MAQAAGDNGRVVTFRNDRLGGRMTALVNAMRLSQALSADLAVHWHVTDDHGRVFNDPFDFFDPGFIGRHFIDRDAYIALRNRIERLDGTPDPAEVQGRIAGGWNQLVERSIGLIALQGEDAASVADAAGAIWRSGLPFAPQLLAPMQVIRDRMGPAAVAYHIRRGDVISVPRAMNRAWPDKFIIDEIFETHIARSCAEGLRPILFSDDPSAVDRFVDLFPGTLRGADLVPAQGMGEGQRDLLELFAMSLCSRIVAPGNSAFSSTAAILGGRELIDITADLTPDEVETAHAAMTLRLETGMDRAIGESPGKVGQSLVHVARRARESGAVPDLRRAADLTLAAITGGAGISHLWSQASALFMELGDLDTVRQLEIASAQQTPYFTADLSRLRIDAALAAAATGDDDLAVALALPAFAESTALAPVAEVTALFYATGILHDGNAPAFSPAAQRLSRIAANHMGGLPAFAALARDLPRDKRGRLQLAGVAPVTWDWAPLIRFIPSGSLARHPRRAAYQKGFDQLLRGKVDADALSLAALWDMKLAESDDWFARMSDLAQAHPEDAMVQLRLSHAAMVTRDYRLTRDAAERAADAAPDSLGHLAWRGIARLRDKDAAGAQADLQAAIGGGLDLPLVLRAAALAAQQTGDIQAEGLHLDGALMLSPRSGPFLMARAAYRERIGDMAGAEGDIATARSLPVVPPKAA